jgi:ABC-type polysaccharide/polyol phosphate export permease
MIRIIKEFITGIYRNRNIISMLAKRDLEDRYKGTVLGFVWVFLQPVLFVAVIYTVFTLGLRGGRDVGMPFSLYLIAGVISWQYFAGLLSSMTAVMQGYSFLIKKVQFRLSVLPIVKLYSGLVPHVFLIIVAIGLAWFQGYSPSLHTFQFIYYLSAMSILSIGIGWITSSTNLFVRDVSKFISVVVQFGFWLTPIFWNISRVPEQYQWILMLNPMVYIVDGYRDALVSGQWFWDKPLQTVYFWGLTIAMLLLGMIVYRKLRPYFAEVV